MVELGMEISNNDSLFMGIEKKKDFGQVLQN